MRAFWFFLAVGMFFGPAVPVAFAGDEIVSVQTRAGVTQRFTLLVPQKPVATVVLFPGGDGKVPLDKLEPGQFVKKGNFLVRIRYDLRNLGLIVAILDVPSDRKDHGLSGFRFSDQHAQDVAAVIDYLKKHADLPVWLVGTSRGTESVASLAGRLAPQLSGIVLTSSITVTNKGGASILDLPLRSVGLPVLVVAHKNDACFVSPPGNAQAIVDAFSASPRKKLLIMEGGSPPQSDPCEALAQHGYVGIESQVTQAIADFVKAGH